MEIEIPAQPTAPNAIMWSEDNQLAMTTGGSVILITPLHARSENGRIGNIETTRIVKPDEKEVPVWKYATEEAGVRTAVLNRGVDIIMSAWSPSGLSSLKWCVLAVICSRHRVVLHAPKSSPIRGEWKVYLDLSDMIGDYFKETDDFVGSRNWDRLESTAVAWSPRILVPEIESLLTLGNKAGIITFWQVGDSDHVKCVKELDTTIRDWIVGVCWSPWTFEGQISTSYLVITFAKGRTEVRKVTLESNIELPILLDISDDILHLNPSRSVDCCTVIRWGHEYAADNASGLPLAIGKGTRVYVWFSHSNNTFHWNGPLALPIADISWDMENKKLFVFFMDGKQTVLSIGKDCLMPDEILWSHIDSTMIASCHPSTIGNQMGDDGEKDEKGDRDDNDDNDDSANADSNLRLRIQSGAASFEGSNLLFCYNVTSALHLLFRRERHQACTLLFGRTYLSHDIAVLDKLFARTCSLLTCENLAVLMNPTRFLWDICFFVDRSMEDPGHFNATYLRLIDLIEALPVSWTGGNDDTEKKLESKHFRTFSSGRAPHQSAATLPNTLSASFYGPTRMNYFRFTVFLSVYFEGAKEPMIKMDSDKLRIFKEKLKEKSLFAQAEIEKHQLLQILLFIQQEATSRSTPLNAAEVNLALVICDHTQALYADSLQLAAASKAIQKQLASLVNRVASHEICAACDEAVVFDPAHPGTGSCKEDHVWDRCSLTGLILSGINNRTCTICSRVVLLDSNKDAGLAKVPWLARVLHANSVCGFCGGRYALDLGL